MLRRTLVIASGYFGPLHRGHLYYLIGCSFIPCGMLKPFVTVIVNNDKQTIQKKYNVIVPEEDRLLVVQCLNMVDHAILAVDEDNTVCKTIRLIHELHGGNTYHDFIFANGGDVTSCREQKVCDELGIKTVFGIGGNWKTNSSSEIIRNAYLSYSKMLQCGDG